MKHNSDLPLKTSPSQTSLKQNHQYHLEPYNKQNRHTTPQSTRPTHHTPAPKNSISTPYIHGLEPSESINDLYLRSDSQCRRGYNNEQAVSLPVKEQVTTHIGLSESGNRGGWMSTV
ncbi:unnamed protein product [Aspergillus oryzae]|nr:unnamed protein product [Aspergillus oryzae]